MIKDRINNYIRCFRNNRQLKVVLIAGLTLCFVAHAFSYFNGTLTAFRETWFPGFEVDYSNTVYSGGFLAPFIAVLNHNAYLPWLNGVIACLMLCFSAYLLCDIWDIKHDLNIWLIVGVLVSDINVTIAHFSYPAVYLSAFLFALISVKIWKHSEWHLFVRLSAGSFFVFISLGAYSPYAVAGPVVVLILESLRLLDGLRIQNVLRRSQEYLIMIVVGGALFAFVGMFVLPDGRVERLTETYGNQIIKTVNLSEIRYGILNGFRLTLKRLCGIYRDDYHIMPQWMAVMLLVCAVILLVMCVGFSVGIRRDKRSYFVFAIYLILIFVSVSAVYPLSTGTINTICTLPFALIYAGMIKYAEYGVISIDIKDRQYKVIGNLAVACVSIILAVTAYKGILVSNMCYARLSNLYTISDGLVKRIVERIEDCEGADSTEEIILVGDITGSHYLSYSRYVEPDLLKILDGIDYVDQTRASLILDNKQLITLIAENTRIPRNISSCRNNDDGYFDDRQTDIISSSPDFPSAGSVFKLDDRIIVKLSEW